MAGPNVAVRRAAPDTLAVSGALVFDNAAVALAQADDMITDTPCGTLDLAGVSRADSAGLACVLSMLATAHHHGGALRVVNLPAGLRALARVCEVDTLLA
jgi:phospholipid transport system transporter-binding protein